MPPLLSFISIRIKDIRDSSTWNIHPFLDTSRSKHLLPSIAKVGVLHPPILIQKKEKTYDIVNGRNRIRCCNLLGAPNLHCGILPPDTPAKTLLAFLFEGQTAFHRLSQPEAAIFLKLCRQHLDDSAALAMLPEEYLPKKNPLRLLKILEFENDILRKLHSGQLTDKIIPELLRMTNDDRSKVVRLISTLHLGGNKQKRLISLCRDIGLRENRTLSSLLHEEDFIEVIEHTTMNIPQKTNRIFEILQKRCFPRSTQAKETFQSQIRNLALPETFTINPSQFFERDEVSLSIRFPDFETCRKTLPALKDLLVKEAKEE